MRHRPANAADSRPLARPPSRHADDEGPVRQGAAPEDGVVESLLRLTGLNWALPDVSTGSRRQSETGPWPRWGRASPSNAGRERPEAWLQWPAAPSDLQVRDQRGPAGGLGSPGATSVTHLSCLTCSARSQPNRRSLASPQVHMTPERATTPSTARQCMLTCTRGAGRGAIAVIPPRQNARPWNTVTAGAVARNEALRASKYLDRAIWQSWSGYNRPSHVEN